jgi:hypothetical protein
MTKRRREIETKTVKTVRALLTEFLAEDNRLETLEMPGTLRKAAFRERPARWNLRLIPLDSLRRLFSLRFSISLRES